MKVLLYKSKTRPQSATLKQQDPIFLIFGDFSKRNNELENTYHGKFAILLY